MLSNDALRKTEPRHEKRDTDNSFVKTEVLMPPVADWYNYENTRQKF